MASVTRFWQWARMDQRNARGGGFFLVIAIFTGLIAGIAMHSPIRGVIAGTVVGILAAMTLWLADRRRSD
jgi:hypothetical protein